MRKRWDEKLESIADVLPLWFNDIASVDMVNVPARAMNNSVDLKDLTEGDRKVILLYDGYRSHMSLAVLELFRKKCFIAYALPAPTSGTTQPLDVGGHTGLRLCAQVLGTMLRQLEYSR